MERPRGGPRSLAARPRDLFARPACSGSGWLGYENRLFALLLRISDKINSAVDTPYCRDRDRHQRFLHAAKSFQWSDDIEGEASKVRDRAKHWHHHVLESVELVTLRVGDDTYDVRQTIEQEGPEVRCQRDQQQSIWQRRQRRVRAHAHRIPDVVRQGRNRLVIGRRSTGEVE